MRILAIADRPPRQSVKKTVSENQIDLIITLGDLGFFELQELQTITAIPKIGVYGNHCSGNYFSELGIRNMHLQTWEFQGITFGGFQGSIRYKENADAIMCTQEEATELLKNFPPVDVFIAHSPPYGINDDATDTSHTGFHALGTYISTHHPKYFLHGHTYPNPDQLVHTYDQTKIVYVYGDQCIEVNF